jgi:hypothetical protein
MNRLNFMRIYNSFYVFLREGEYTIVSPTAVGEEKGSRDPRVRRGRQWGAGTRWWRDLGCVEGCSGEPGRDGGGIFGASREAVGSRCKTAAGSWVRRGRQWGAGARRQQDLGCVEGGSGEPRWDGNRRCWGETNLIRIIIDIFSTILYIN